MSINQFEGRDPLRIFLPFLPLTREGASALFVSCFDYLQDTFFWKARHFLRSSVQFFPDPWLSNILRIGTQFKPRTDRFVYPYFLFTEKQLSQFLSAATFPIWHFKVLFLFSEAMKKTLPLLSFLENSTLNTVNFRTFISRSGFMI